MKYHSIVSGRKILKNKVYSIMSKARKFEGRIFQSISILLNLVLLVQLSTSLMWNYRREKIYEVAVKRRNIKLEETKLVSKFQRTPDIWYLYEPLWACPDIELVGDFHDGVKWVCGLRRLRKGCVVYSFGSNGDDQFERDILQKTQCEVFTFDPTLDHEKENMLSQDVLKNFHRVGLAEKDGVLKIDNKNRDVRNLKSIMKRLHHERIDILKIDIEGAEYAVFEELYVSGFP